jgi:hypothetical protein
VIRIAGTVTAHPPKRKCTATPPHAAGEVLAAPSSLPRHAPAAQRHVLPETPASTDLNIQFRIERVASAHVYALAGILTQP